MSEPIAQTVNSVYEAARKLHIDDQYALYNRLYDDLHGGPDCDDEATLSPEWQAEIERRVAEVEAGTSDLIPAEEVLAKLLSLKSQPVAAP